MYAIMRGKEELFIGRDPGDVLSQFARRFPNMRVQEFIALGYKFVPALSIAAQEGQIVSGGLYVVTVEKEKKDG